VRTSRATLLISLRRAANGHICTLDSGGVLALHSRRSGRSVYTMRGINMHNMFQSGTDFLAVLG
jgi:hypothetical protein